MLDTLQKMSGVTHRAVIDSKTITRDMEKIWMKNEGKASYTMTAREVPVISYNDMAFISERNSIVFRAGDSPIWNRNETILPMSWRLFKDTIKQPGKDYNLQTIPTLSSAVDFDVRMNQPDFRKMLDKRMEQAVVAKNAKKMYQDAYNYSDYDIEKQDPDIYSDEVMDLINRIIRAEKSEDEEEVYVDDMDFEQDFEVDYMGDIEENTEQIKATAEQAYKYEQNNKKLFADHLIAPNDLVGMSGVATHAFDKDIIESYLEVKGDMERDIGFFDVRDGSLYGVDGSPYIISVDSSKDLTALNEAAKDENSKIYSEGNIDKKDISAIGSYEVTDEFYKFLASQSAWRFAKGRFEREMAKRLRD